jgi:hypothetical protein
MMKTLYKDIPLKSGETLTKGSKVTVRAIPDNYRACIVNNGVRDYPLRYTSVFKVPSDNCLMESMSDGVCMTPAGNPTEPDGYDDEGFPSWLLILGMI